MSSSTSFSSSAPQLCIVSPKRYLSAPFDSVPTLKILEITPLEHPLPRLSIAIFLIRFKMPPSPPPLHCPLRLHCSPYTSCERLPTTRGCRTAATMMSLHPANNHSIFSQNFPSKRKIKEKIPPPLTSNPESWLGCRH